MTTRPCCPITNVASITKSCHAWPAYATKPGRDTDGDRRAGLTQQGRGATPPWRRLGTPGLTELLSGLKPAQHPELQELVRRLGRSLYVGDAAMVIAARLVAT